MLISSPIFWHDSFIDLAYWSITQIYQLGPTFPLLTEIIVAYTGEKDISLSIITPQIFILPTQSMRFHMAG